MTLFDSYLMVDWSARSAPSPDRDSADAIWIGIETDGVAERPIYRRTRAGAMDWLAERIAAEQAAGHRVLAGFDFPFGYPRGFAAALTGRAEALAVWDWLGAQVVDAPDNANNRTEVAARVNQRFGGGPFWGRARSAPFPAVPEKKSDRAPTAFPEFRHVETAARGAKTCWQIAYAGSVGGQALLGIPALRRLRADPRLAGAEVWPFETGLAVPDALVTLVEIYPSLFATDVRAARADHSTKDAAQVAVTASTFAALDRTGALAPLFTVAELADPTVRAIVAAEEGWILGAAALNATTP